MVDNVASLIIAGKLHEGDTARIDVGADDQLVAEPVPAGENSDQPSDDTPVEPDTVE